MIANNTELLGGWIISYHEVSNNVYRVTLTDINGRQSACTDSNINCAIETCLSYALDIKKHLKIGLPRFLFDLCRFKLSNKQIISEDYNAEVFGNWIICLSNKRIIYDGKDGILFVEYRATTELYEEQFSRNVSTLTYEELINAIE